MIARSVEPGFVFPKIARDRDAKVESVIAVQHVVTGAAARFVGRRRRSAGRVFARLRNSL